MAFKSIITLLLILCILGSSFVTEARRAGKPTKSAPATKKRVVKRTIKKTTRVIRRPISGGVTYVPPVVVVAPPVYHAPPIYVAPPIVVRPPVVYHTSPVFPATYVPYYGPVVNVNPFMKSSKPPTRPVTCNSLPQGIVNVYRITDEQQFKFNCLTNQATGFRYKPRECAQSPMFLKYNFVPQYATTYVYSCATSVQTKTAPLDCIRKPTSVVYTYSKLSPGNLQYSKYDCRTHVGPTPATKSSVVGLIVIIVLICICICVIGAFCGAKESEGEVDEEHVEEVIEEETVVVGDDQPPQVVYQDPGMGYQQPGMVYQQPGMGYQQPGMGYQQPGMGYQQPGMMVQQPGMVMQQPGYVQPGYPQQDVVVGQQYAGYDPQTGQQVMNEFQQ